jgi:F0F1-type ATP synthase membrane subunit b/b'
MANPHENIQTALEHTMVYAGMVDIDKSLFFMLGLFLLFAILLYVLVMKPLIAAQEQRHAGTGGAREGASQIELTIAERKRDYEQRLGAAKKDAVRIREDIKEQASAASAARMAEARGELEGRHQAELGAIAAAGDKARAEIGANADRLADAVVAKLLGGK